MIHSKAKADNTNSFAKGRQFKKAASFEVRDLDSPYERPLGVDRAAERLDAYLAGRRREGGHCRADAFCNGVVVRERLCATHLMMAHRARVVQAMPTTAKSYKIGRVGIGQR